MKTYKVIVSLLLLLIISTFYASDYSCHIGNERFLEIVCGNKKSDYHFPSLHLGAHWYGPSLQKAVLSKDGMYCACGLVEHVYENNSYKRQSSAIEIIKKDKNGSYIKDRQDPLCNGDDAKNRFYMMHSQHDLGLHEQLKVIDIKWMADHSVIAHVWSSVQELSVWHINQNGKTPFYCCIDVGNKHYQPLSMAYIHFPALYKALVKQNPYYSLRSNKISLIMLGFTQNEHFYLPKDITNIILWYMYKNAFLQSGEDKALYGIDNPSFTIQDKHIFQEICSLWRKGIPKIKDCIDKSDYIDDLTKDNMLFLAHTCKKWEKCTSNYYKPAKEAVSFNFVQQVFNELLSLEQDQPIQNKYGTIRCLSDGSIRCNNFVAVKPLALRYWEQIDTMTGSLSEARAFITAKQFSHVEYTPSGIIKFYSHDNSVIGTYDFLRPYNTCILV